MCVCIKMKKEYCQTHWRTDSDICGSFSIPLEIMAQKCDSDFLFYACGWQFFFSDKKISSSPRWVVIFLRKGSDRAAWIRVSCPANRELPATGNKHREILTSTTNVSTDFELTVAWGWALWVPSLTERGSTLPAASQHQLYPTTSTPVHGDFHQ